MQSGPHEEFSRWVCGALFLLSIALFATRNLPWHLDNYDQAKQAFTSFEMIAENHWWFQHTPTGHVATKPPLAGWISAALFYLSGSEWWDGAWRLPPLFSAVAILALLWKCGKTLFGGNVGGVLSAGAFSLNVFTPRLAALVRTDMLLTLFLFLVGYLILEQLRGGGPWTAWHRCLLFLCLLASMFTKGPIAYAFLLPGLVACRFFARRFGLLDCAWSGWWSWFGPLIPFGVWAAVGLSTSSEFYHDVVWKEFFGRFDVSENPIHKHQPLYFYIGHLLLRAAPWSLLLVAFLSVKRVRRAMREDPVLLWLVCWSVGGLLVMSLVPSKRFDRIFPVVPPLCLLLAATARHLPDGRWKGQSVHRWTAIAAAIAAAASTAYAAENVWSGFRTTQRGLVVFGQTVRGEVGTATDRLAIINGKDEGMLLYIGKTGFTAADAAIAAWNSGELDWLIIPRRDLRKQASKLGDFERVAETRAIPEKSSSYVLIRLPVLSR